MAPDGTPRTVTVVPATARPGPRRLRLRRARTGRPRGRRPGKSSRGPGLRPNQIVWQGFSPRRKVLVAVAELRPGGSVPALPVRVRVTGVAVRAGPLRAHDLARERDADAARRDSPPTCRRPTSSRHSPIFARRRPMIARSRIGSFASAAGAGPATVDAWAALAVRGAIAFPAGAVSDLAPARFTGLLRGGTASRHGPRRAPARATTPKLRLVVEPAPRAALPPRSARTLEATVARLPPLRAHPPVRAVPREPRSARADGDDRTLYETAAPPRASTRAAAGSADDSGLPTALRRRSRHRASASGSSSLWAHL